MAQKIDTFLDRATTGLASDPELRLDVQAELRSHIEDKTAELGGDEHADEAVASLGEVVELAEEVSQANQRRLGWRNWARRAIRFGLVPLAVLAAVFLSDPGRSLGMFQFMESLGLANSHIPGHWEWFRPYRNLSARDEMVLHGDGKRGASEQYRTLWEQNPTNRVYYADHITHLLAVTPMGTGDPADTRKMTLTPLLHELSQARSVDPQNGRYPLLASVTRARMAAEVDSVKAADGKTQIHPLVVTDRPALDQAMKELLAATSMPEYHCYYREMLSERLALLPPPTSLVETIHRVAISASTLLPDMTQVREAARFAVAYAQLLTDEGRAEEARRYLGIPETLSRWTAGDSFTLIEMLVSNAVANIAYEIVPKTLREMGRQQEAEQAQQRLGAIRAPMQEWRDNRQVGETEMSELLRRRGSWLARMLLPALGGQEDIAAFEPRLAAGRFLEFTVVTEGLVSLLQLLLIATMLACLVISLRWRLTLGSQSAPLLLLPSWRDLTRAILLGIALPFAVFLAWTQWVPISGQAYSFQYAAPRILVEFLALVLALLLVPSWLAIRSFRRRCVELELPAPPRLHRIVRVVCWFAAGLLVVVYLLPPQMWPLPRLSFLAFLLGSLLIAAAILCMAGLALFVPRRHARTVGTLSRSLIPVFAVAVLALSLVVHPLLRLRERQLLHADTVLGAAAEPCFTKIESDLTDRLREATLKAMAENPMPRDADGRAE